MKLLLAVYFVGVIVLTCASCATGDGTDFAGVPESLRKVDEPFCFDKSDALGAYTEHRCAWGAELLARRELHRRLGRLNDYDLFSNPRWKDGRQEGRNIFFEERPLDFVYYGGTLGDKGEDEVAEMLDSISISILRALDTGRVVSRNSFIVEGACAFSEVSFVIDGAAGVHPDWRHLARIQLTWVAVKDADAEIGVQERLMVLPNYHGGIVFMLDAKSSREIIDITRELYSAALGK